MTQPDDNSRLPPPRQLSARTLMLRTVLGIVLLALGIYSLTRRSASLSPPLPPPPAPALAPATTPSPLEPSSTPSPPVTQASSPPTPSAKIEADVAAIAFTRDGRLIVARRAGVAIHDVVSGARQLPPAQVTGVRDVACSPDGSTIAFATGPAAPTSLWSLPAGSSRIITSGATLVRFSPDGRTLAAAFSSGEVRLLDVLSGNNNHTCRVDIGQVASLAYAPDGGSIAAAGSSGATVWDIPGNRQRARLLRDVACPSVDYSPDSHTLALAGDTGATLSETVFFQRIATLYPGQPVTRVAYWRGGTCVVMSLADGSIQIWDTTMRQRTMSLPTTGPLTAFALSPDDRTLAATSGTSVTIWDTIARSSRALPQ
jgi:WD40 repeat protein